MKNQACKVCKSAQCVLPNMKQLMEAKMKWINSLTIPISFAFLPSDAMNGIKQMEVDKLCSNVYATGNPEIIACFTELMPVMDKAYHEALIEQFHKEELYWKKVQESRKNGIEYSLEAKERIVAVKERQDKVFDDVKLALNRSFLVDKEFRILRSIREKISEVQALVDMIGDPWLSERQERKEKEFNSIFLSKLAEMKKQYDEKPFWKRLLKV